jgi:hypothetical protein
MARAFGVTTAPGARTAPMETHRQALAAAMMAAHAAALQAAERGRSTH